MNVFNKAESDKAKIHLNTAGLNFISGKRDLESFDNEIKKDEKIFCIVAGKMVQVSNDRFRGIGFSGGNRQAVGTDTKGVLVITDHKAIFMDKRLFGKQTTIIDGENISSVTQSNGILSARIMIQSFGRQYDITDLKKVAANDAIEALNKLKKIAKSNKQNNTIINKENSGMEEIKKAKELLDTGIISKEEFEQVKKKYL